MDSGPVDVEDAVDIINSKKRMAIGSKDKKKT